MYHAGRLLSCLRNRHQLILFRYRYNSYFPLLQAIRYGQYGSDFYRTLVGQRWNRYYERRKSLRVKSHERSFSKNDEDDCRNPNGALPRPPGFFKAWKHPEEVGKRKSRSTMLRLLRSVAWIFLEWLRPRIAILRFPKQDKVHSFISKSKRGLPSVATWSKLATNFNELDAQNNQEANHE